MANHHGQHAPDCYGCKLRSLSFDRGSFKTHSRRGDPWDGNPVAERIEELRSEGRKVSALEIKNKE